MYIAILALLLMASAFFSGSETAFLSIGKLKLKELESIDAPRAKRVVKLLSDPHKLLVTILVGNTLVNIAASAVFTEITYRALGETGILVSIASMTAIILVFGEVTPKMFSLANSVKVTYLASLPLKFFEKVFAPLRSVLTGAAYKIVRGLGIRVSSERPKITEQEIRSLVSIGKIKGVVKEKEKDMIDNILKLKDLNAADIMTPRIDAVALDLTLERGDIVMAIKQSQYSRFPVYVHTLDNIVGILHSKDALLDVTTPIKDLVRKPYFAPESMKVDDLLQALQRKHMHIAIVTDEYGVTSGIVTIEDVLEEIVGEIRDELDIEVPNIRMIDQKTYEINGQTHVGEVSEEIGLDIETDEVDTIGGYVTLVIGKIPQAGDKIEIKGFQVTVKDVSKNRITRLTVEKL